MSSKTDSFHDMTISQLGGILAKGEASSREVTQGFIDRIGEVEPAIQAFITQTPEHALKQADAADARLKNGERGDLLGIPLGIKDNMCTKGIRTTCASKILSNFVPPYDATVIDRLNAAGAT